MRSSAGAPDRVFVAGDGGRIWTGTGSPVKAVAVVDGRVAAVDDDALALRSRHTEVWELRGQTLLPAFRDGHIHPLEGGAESLDCDLVDAMDVDEVLRRLAAFAADRPGDGWIVGYGHPTEILPGGVGRASVLDAVVANRPVALWSSDHHMTWVNSRALQVAGIAAGTPDPDRGVVVRDDAGHPVGTLLEEADRLLTPHLPPRDPAREAEGLRIGLARMAAAGIVWAQEAKTHPARVGSYQRVADAGQLTADLDLAFLVDVDRWRDQVADFLDARVDAAAAAATRRADGVPGGNLTATTVKIFVDGVIEGGTGALTTPYCDAPHSHGILYWEREELLAAARAMYAAGFQLHLHAIGDAAVRLALDAIETAGDPRGVVAHTHLVHPDDRARFRRIGAIANFEPLWAQRNAIMTDLTEPRLGPERSAWQYPIGTLIRDGAHVSFGSDWPVSSLVPLEGIAVAVSRQTVDGEPPDGYLPEERIDLDAALRAYTAGSAYQAGMEDEAGRIAVGQRADFAVVDADVTVVPAGDLGDVEVVGTWLAGRQVYQRP